MVGLNLYSEFVVLVVCGSQKDTAVVEVMNDANLKNWMYLVSPLMVTSMSRAIFSLALHKGVMKQAQKQKRFTISSVV